MQKFNNPFLVRSFVFDEKFGISAIGYHDFSRHYNPAYNSRIQNFYTLHFVLSGKGILKIGEKTYTIGDGEMFFLPDNTEFCYYPTEDEPWEYVWFSLKGDICMQYANQLGFDGPVKKCTNFNNIKHLLKKLFDILDDNGGYFGVLSVFYGIMELSTSNRIFTGVESVKRVIDESFTHTGFTIASLCSDVNISHPHLIRLFKERYNTTLVKYLNKKRIEYACTLLATTDLSVKSVAFSSGFADELHFMKTFKKHMGVTALQYRNKK